MIKKTSYYLFFMSFSGCTGEEEEADIAKARGRDFRNQYFCKIISKKKKIWKAHANF